MSNDILTFKISILNDFKENQFILFSKHFYQCFESKTGLQIGIEILVKDLNINDHRVRSSIWLIYHEKRWKSMIPYFLEGSAGILIMCDISFERSIMEIEEWLKNILDLSINRSSKNNGEMFDINPESLTTLKNSLIPTILVGYISNDKESKIPYTQIREIAKTNGLDGYAICNIQTGENIKEIFQVLARFLFGKSGLTPVKISQIKKMMICGNCGANLSCRLHFL